MGGLDLSLGGLKLTVFGYRIVRVQLHGGGCGGRLVDHCALFWGHHREPRQPNGSNENGHSVQE